MLPILTSWFKWPLRPLPTFSFVNQWVCIPIKHIMIIRDLTEVCFHLLFPIYRGTATHILKYFQTVMVQCLTLFSFLAVNKSRQCSVAHILQAPCWKRKNKDWKIWKELQLQLLWATLAILVKWIHSKALWMGYDSQGTWLNTVPYFEHSEFKCITMKDRAPFWCYFLFFFLLISSRYQFVPSGLPDLILQRILQELAEPVFNNCYCWRVT